MTTYQKYQLQWMIDHDHPICELIANLDRYQKDWECETITELYSEWENNQGFGSGSIWACLDEWRDCEGSDRK